MQLKYKYLFVLSVVFLSISLVTHAQITTTLQQGVVHQDVSILQRILNTLGKNVTVTGQETTYFGNQTASALKSFQCETGIVCGEIGWGIVGPKTRELLNSLVFSFGNLITNASQTSQLAAISGSGSDLVAHYTFDGNANDSAGSNEGTTNGGPTYTSGKIGEALTFDGIDDEVVLDNLTDFDFSQENAFTISAWVYPNTSDGRKTIISRGGINNGASNDVYALATYSTNNRWYGHVGNGSNTITVLASANTVELNTWQFMTLVWDGSTLSLYKNASSIGSTQNQDFGSVWNGSSSAVRETSIGANGRTESNFWDGSLDDVRIYSRALSTSEIQELYTNRDGSTSTPEPDVETEPTQDTQAPSVPTNLSASVISSSQIQLSWSASTDTTGVTGYRIYRNGTQITTTTNTSYANTGLSASTQYIYTVAAYDAAGNISSQSAQEMATTQSFFVPTTPTTTPTLLTGTIFYIRDGGTTPNTTGSNCGTDWTNACDVLPATLIRGATYYIADGSYGSYIFDDVNSGTKLITVKKAIAGEHGTNVGWLSSYGNGQGEFSSISFSSGYYEINGQTGGGPGSWDSGYGFRIYVTTNTGAKLIKFNNSVNNITLKHLDISYDYNNNLSYPAGSDVTSGQDALYSTADASDITISYCRFNKPGRTALLTRSDWDNIILEYNYFKQTTFGARPTQHGEIWSATHGLNGLTNVTIRNNNFDGYASTGGLIMSGANGVYIHGNIFQNAVNEANGSIANWSAEAVSKNVYIYNNTFVDTDATIGFGNTSGWVSYNNLFYNNNRVNFAGANHNYSASDINLSELNDQTGITSSIFSNYSAGDYRLNLPTQSGLTLSSPYNTDMYGNIRGTDGIWDRGAYEYVSGNIIPTIPTNQIPVVNAGEDRSTTIPVTSITMRATASDPDDDNLTYSWSSVSGPRSVTSSSLTVLNPTFAFPVAGTYVLRLSVSDGTLSAADDITVIVHPSIVVNKAPIVSAGSDQTITLPNNTFSPNVTVADDGLPTSVLTVSWRKISGPETVTFTPTNVANTVMSFSEAGTYTMRLSVSDGSLSSTDDLTVEVDPEPTSVLTDKDLDGVEDTEDRCLHTPARLRSTINVYGCPEPLATKFDIKPDFTTLDLLSTTRSSFEIGRTNYGKISFTNKSIALVKTENDNTQSQLDFDTNLSIEKNKITLNSTNLPTLNQSAVITFYNTGVETPKILRDGVECSNCSITSHTDETVVVSVEGFSTYEVVEGYIAPTSSNGGSSSSSSSRKSGGSSRGTTVIVPKASSSELTESSLIAIIQSLIAQIQAIALQRGITISLPSFSLVPTTSVSGTFSRDLELYSEGEDVRRLQKYLNSRGYIISTIGAGSTGNESTFFGLATRSALIRFQKAKGITPSQGYFGPKTRAVIGY